MRLHVAGIYNKDAVNFEFQPTLEYITEPHVYKNKTK